MTRCDQAEAGVLAIRLPRRNAQVMYSSASGWPTA
jgi:hypothetical protein